MQQPSSKLYGPARVGGDALAYCTKCRMELAHVIVSMLDGKPSKVECKTCRGVHRYKLSGGVVKPRRPAGTARPTKTVVRAAELWEQKLAEKTQADEHPYNATQTFKSGQVIRHPTFGLGIVEAIKGPTKMDILFRDGEKTLVHGMGKKN